MISFQTAFGQVSPEADSTVKAHQRETLGPANDLASLESLYLQKRAKLDRQQKWVRWGFSWSLLGLIMGALLLVRKQKQLKRQFQLQATKEALLHLQMNPHFLFNALSSIQSLLFDQENRMMALQYLSKFAHLMREVLASAQETKITLARELQILEHYLSIQQFRFEHLFDFEIETGQHVLAWNTLVPPFLLQPFIEAAIEQGQFNKVENAWIKIEVKKEKDLILLRLENNGWHHFLKDSSLEGDSTAKNTLERLKLINKIWRKPIQFNFQELPGQLMEVVFKIPV